MIERIFMGAEYLAKGIMIATIIYMIICEVWKIVYKEKRLFKTGFIVNYIFLVYIATIGMITRVLDVASWSYGGLRAWNIQLFVNESWKLMFLNALMFVPMGILHIHIGQMTEQNQL